MHLSRRAAALTTAVGAVAVACIAIPVVAAANPAVTTTAAPAKIPPLNNTCSVITRMLPGDHLTASNPNFRTLVGNGISNGSACNTTSTGFRLVLQPDGNLVEYEDGPVASTAIWTAQTNTATSLTFQPDGNVVLRDAQGKALWSTGTAGTAAAYFSVYGNGQMVLQTKGGVIIKGVGRSLTPVPGSFVRIAQSPQRRYFLQTQPDGNVVEYQYTSGAPRAVWQTGTRTGGGVRLAAQSDGNLVLYRNTTNTPIWSSNTHGPAAYYQLDVQDDANVVLYRTDGAHRLQAVWASNTHV